MKKILLIIFIVVLAWNLNAQTYNMNNTPVTTCSGTFYDSGGSGGDYSSSEDFEKTFTPSIAGNMLEFDFTFFECESATFDWLEIYDGPTTASPLIGTYGGTVSPGVITATNPTGELTFKWHSDGSVTYPGWSANISCITITSYLMTNGSETTCSGVFMDPEGTGGYNDFNGSMTMTFNSGSTDQLQFDFIVFQTNEAADNLKIYDGPTTASPLIGTYSQATSPGTIVSSGNSLTFVWTTDNNQDGDPGWRASISCIVPAYLMNNTDVTACSGTFYDSGGSAGDYASSEDFEKTFTPSIAGNMLEFVFTSFETESATFDWLEIYNGPTTASPLIGKYGGTTGPGTVTAANPTGELTFVWHSDASVTDPGWSADISCSPPTNMSYVSSNVTQPNTANVAPNDVEQEIICIEIVMDGTLNPLDVTNLHIRTNGSDNPTNDIMNAKIWFTGSSNVFAMTTQYGPTIANPPTINTTMDISATQTLSAGSNYFWLTYDIRPGAAGNNVVDGCCYRVQVDGTDYLPTVYCPAGSRTIIVPPTNNNPCQAELLPVSSGICNYTTRHNIDATNSSVPNPSCSFYGGQDVWFKVVVPASGRLIVDMDLAGGPTNFDMAWYTGSDCNNLTELECDGYQSQNGSMPMICRTGMLCTVPGDCDQNATLTPGDTVWIRVWEYDGGSTGLFDICAYEPDPPGPPSNCSSPTNIASLPYTANNLTTCCKQNDYTPTDGCANSYMDGEDYMFTYTPSVNQLINITISGTGSYTGVFVTDKCPDAGGVNCIAQNTNSSGNPFLCDVSLDAGTTYYIMVDTDPTPNCTNFNIQVSEAFAPTCNLNYTVSSIPYTAYPVTGTAISLPIDDRFSEYIPIGFPFCYDGIQYTQLLVSSNGYVIFDPVGCATNLPSANAAPGGYSGYSISATVPNTTNAPRNAIMFPWQDTDPSISGNLRYRLYGTAPNRYFVLSVNQLAYFSSSCTGYEFTGQLILRETTNNIEVHMLRKDKCTAWNSGRAILGLHNYNGTIALCPPSRNMGEWIANSESWQFTCNCPGCIVLPIELMSFNGENLDISTNKLQWKTASELNNEYFEIERKDQYADEFVKIGEHDGAGFSNIIQEYDFVDDEVKTEVSYYRLKQVDYNGEYSYSNIISIGNTPEAENRIYPNPANDVLNLSFNVMAESITVYIVNTIGEVVYQESYVADNSIQSKIDISKFAAGTYQILVRDDKSNVIMQEQLIIQR